MECPICFNPYADGGVREPRFMIPCGHTMCISCLRQLQPSKCPCCNQEISGNVEDLPKNFSLIEAIGEKN